MPTESFINKAPTAKAELAAELAYSVVQDGSEVLREGTVIAAINPVRVVVRGREIDNFSGWDFLGISGHPRLERAAGGALRDGGVGNPLPRESGGFTPELALCEQRFAAFYGGEGATLFSQKSQSILSIVTTFCKQGDLVLALAGGAWGFPDACAVADVEYEEFSDLQELERRLERMNAVGRRFRRIVLCLEVVSTLSGEVFDIARFFSMAVRFGCLTIVDESAGFGVLGTRGAGSAESLPRHQSLLARAVSLSGCSGIEVAALVGPRELRELLYRRSYYLRRECAPSNVAVRSARELIDIVETAAFQRGRVMAHANRVVHGLRGQGWSVGGGDGVPLVCVRVESLRLARQIQGALLDQEVLVDVVQGSAPQLTGGVVRVALSAAHNDEVVSKLLSAFGQVRLRLVE